MRTLFKLTMAAAVIAMAGSALAAAPAAPAAPPAAGAAAPVPQAKTVYDQVVTATTPKLTLTSTSIKEGQPIADTYSQNGANKSPALTWTAGPASTKAYVVVAQDTTTANAVPTQHWILWNIPADVKTLPEGVPLGATLDNPKGAMQATAGGNAGFRGPKPPAGSTHFYVFQVFAIDAPLSGIDTTVAAPALITALMGHVVAAGEFISPYTGK